MPLENENERENTTTTKYTKGQYSLMDERSARLAGMVPVKRLSPSSNCFILGTLSTRSSSLPVNLFPVRSRDINLPDKVDGTVPERKLRLRRSRLRPALKVLGNVPVSLFFSRTSMSRLPSAAISLGIGPMRLFSTSWKIK